MSVDIQTHVKKIIHEKDKAGNPTKVTYDVTRTTTTTTETVETTNYTTDHLTSEKTNLETLKSDAVDDYDAQIAQKQSEINLLSKPDETVDLTKDLVMEVK